MIVLDHLFEESVECERVRERDRGSKMTKSKLILCDKDKVIQEEKERLRKLRILQVSLFNVFKRHLST